jgi:hypothetical protein
MPLRLRASRMRRHAPRVAVAVTSGVVLLLPLLVCSMSSARGTIDGYCNPTPTVWTTGSTVHTCPQYYSVGFDVTDQAQGGLHMRCIQATGHYAFDPGHWYEPGEGGTFYRLTPFFDDVAVDYHFKWRMHEAGPNQYWKGTFQHMDWYDWQ